MNRHTGKPLDEDAHISQSITDILSTPLGSRIKRRTYGSMLPDLVDHPGNQANRLRLQAATVMAIIRWEPRVSITSVALSQQMDGKAQLDITATKRTGARSGQRITIAHPLQ
ncbi:GPW/gp25 family protein [Dechloromonas denitrificans]|uniref:GPW/gp25 family protein n=1 Tax=Dechloromonas denitrificans TaxID=281362 RepID=UPI001CF8E64D|nr:GPW/gp25 family protein [Dechloromonas denitrificans]UCV02303.1 GPW/gp25 family protein [Dechloromonas denitrificans]